MTQDTIQDLLQAQRNRIVERIVLLYRDDMTMTLKLLNAIDSTGILSSDVAEYAQRQRRMERDNAPLVKPEGKDVYERDGWQL